MLKSCSACGKVHDSSIRCRRRFPKRTSQADAFRNTYLWQTARAQAKERDHHLCVRCRVAGVIECDSLSVHHIVPLEEDISLAAELSNLITLCSSCHERAEAGEISRVQLMEWVKQFSAEN